jgi:ribosomal protein S2
MYNHKTLINQDIFLDITKITYLQLAFAGLHIGEEIRMHSPKNISLVYAKAKDHIVFDLKYNLLNIKKGLFLMSYLVSNRGKFLYIDESSSELQEYNNALFEFRKLGHNFINSKWRSGFITNFKRIYFDICQFIFFIQQGFLLKNDLIENKLNFCLGLLDLRRLPSFIFISGIHKCFWSSLETLRLKIPSLIVTDTSNDISNFFLPIYSHFSNIENDYLDISAFFVDLYLSIIISSFIIEMADYFMILIYKYRLEKLTKKIKKHKSYIIKLKKNLNKYYLKKNNIKIYDKKKPLKI